jgi:pyruvate formate lyase activating enzyme
MEYYVQDKNKYMCLLCSHYCKLGENQVGICGVNKNVGDKIECLVYGKISALNIDPIEKKPLYHFFPGSKSLSFGTVGCNFKCSFCQNWSLSQEKDISKSEHVTVNDIVTLARSKGCDSISYTYN